MSDRRLLITEGLDVRLGSAHVLRGIDLSLEAGRILGLVGPNGAGKTTTMRALTGLLDVFSGEVRVLGHDPRVEPRAVKECVGYLPENAPLPGSLTVAEFLLLVGRLHGLDDLTIRRRGDVFLDAFELGHRLSSRCETLSKGMCQKVLLVASLLHSPRLLLVDEPLSGLDARSVRLVSDLFRRFADSGRGIVYCSHVLDQVERTCDEICILDQGRVVGRGDFSSLAETTRESSLDRILQKLAPDPEPRADARPLINVLD